MKRLVAFLLALVLAVPTYALAAGTTYEVKPEVVCNGSTVSVYPFIYAKEATGNGKYNAFQFTFLYDPTMLMFAKVENSIKGMNNRQLEYKHNETNGTLIVSGCGEDVDCNNTPVVIHFTTKNTGTTQVRLVEALVSERSSVKSDAAVATIPNTETCKNGVLTITTGSFKVTLPNNLGLFGDSSVVSNGTYTFRGSPYYDYNLTAKINGSEVDIKKNADGTFSVENVTGALVISGNRTPKSYSVTVSGSGASDVTASTTATYDSDYTFSIKKADVADYAVTATVDGRVVSLTDNGSSSYTIAGTQITGDITITVSKAAKSGTTLVIFSGSGAEDLPYKREYTATQNSEFKVPIGCKEGFSYQIMANGRALTIGADNCIYIPADLLTGSILAVTVTKTAKINMTVTVNPYSALKTGGYAYLITAKNNDTAQAGQGFAYEGTPMYYSEKYSAFALVIAASKAPTVETVKSKLTVSTEPYTTVAYNGDVNTTGRVDVNDAQLVYDMYLGKYALSAEGITQMMWLRADAAGGKSLDVQDVQTVLQAIA